MGSARRVLMTALIAALTTSATASAETESTAWESDRPKIRLGVRFSLLARRDDGYFRDARVFAESPSVSTSSAHLSGDAIPPAAGVILEAGSEIVPRLSVMGSFRTFTNGVKTGNDMRLSVNTRAWMLDARLAALRVGGATSGATWLAQIELVAGGGWVGLNEQFVDRALFDGTITQNASGLGGRFGLDASTHVAGFGVVLGYGYLVSGAAIHDRIGGTVHAGGHEFSLGLALRF